VSGNNIGDNGLIEIAKGMFECPDHMVNEIKVYIQIINK
jgi:hypothetical protein